MTEITVDKKHRIVLPKELRKALKISVGSVLEAERRGSAIILVPKVSLKKPTQALWGMAADVTEESPKKIARESIAKRHRLGR